jgi:hypothetical protein
MRWFLFLLCFLGCVLNLPAQTVHFDNPHNFNSYDYALYSGVVAYRIGDFVTTEKRLLMVAGNCNCRLHSSTASQDS